MVMTAEDGRNKFLSDSPIEAVDEDEFRHKEYVDTLEQMVKNADPAWNIGVFGEWGSGKTSIIRMLYSRLRDSESGYVCVEFDAWKHAEESIRTDLLLNLDRAIGEKTGQTDDEGKPAVLGEEKITDELYDVEEASERTKDERSTKEAVKQFFHEQRYVAYSIVGISAIALLAGIFISPPIGAGIFTVVLAPLFLHMAKQLSDATDTLQRKFLYPRREWSGAYENLFERILDETDADKVVISIDNLDRCESETVYDVLVSLKTFLEKDQCVYIIPCDDQALQSHIESIDDRGEYFESTRNGREFLRKFFQTHIRIPRFIPEDIEEYAKSKNDNLAEPFDQNVIDVITSAYVKNPRRIKQSLNQLTTLRILAEQIEEEDHLDEGTLTDHLDFLAKVMVLQEDFPEFYSELEDDPRLLEDVREYFRGDLSEGDRENRIEDLLRKENGSTDSESRLEKFLRSTIPYRVDNPQPFLRLGEPSFLSDLSDAEAFLQNLRTRQEGDVRNKIESIREDDQSIAPYFQAIDSTLDSYVSEARFNPLFSTVDTLLTVFDEFEEEYQGDVGEVLGRYLVLEPAQGYLSDFDPEEFFPVLLEIPDENQRTIFTRYSLEVDSGGQLRENVLQAFVDHADQVPDEAQTQLCETLLDLDSGFNRSLEILSQTEQSKKLANSDLLERAAESVTWDSQRNQFEETEHYIQLDSQARANGRQYFVEQLLDLEEEVDNEQGNQYNNELQQYLSRLNGQVTRETGDRLFDILEDRVSSANGQPVDLAKVAISFYESYSPGTKEDFQDWIANLLSRWNQGRIQQIAQHAEEEGVPIFDDENTVDSVCSQVPNKLNNDSFVINSLIPAIPEKHNKRLFELLEMLCEDNDHSNNLIGAKIFTEYPDRFGPVREQVLDRCRTQISNSNNADQKKTYLRVGFAVFDDLDDSEQESMLTQLDSLLSGNHQDHRAFKDLWQEVDQNLTEDQKKAVARNLDSQLRRELRNNIQHNQLFPLVEVFSSMSGSGIIEQGDGEWVAERLSDQFEGSNLNNRQVANLIEKMGDFEEYYGEEKTVLTRLESLIKNNNNSQIRSSGRKLVDSIAEVGDVKEDRIEKLKQQLAD